MKIISFDSAIKNMGFCYVEYDEEWETKLQILSDKIEPSLDKKDFMKECLALLKEIDKVLSNALVVKYLDVFDTGSASKGHQQSLEIAHGLADILLYIDGIIQNPDCILIEYQMLQNDKSRIMSNQIIYHYINKTAHSSTEGKTKSLIAGNISNDRQHKIHIVGCSLKNSIALYKGGSHQNFVSKYSNYTANKNHTKSNFKRFAELFDVKVPKTKKIDDMADAFMMIMGWIANNLPRY
jgi:hypothetical protein